MCIVRFFIFIYPDVIPNNSPPVYPENKINPFTTGILEYVELVTNSSMHLVGDIYSGFYRNSEANVLESRKNLDDIFPEYW